MARGEDLYSYDGVSRDEIQLQHLPRDLHTAITEIFRTRGADPYLTWVGTSSRLTRTFGEFEHDLRARSQELQARVSASTQVIACIGGNTYNNLLNIAASLLCGYSVFPLNGADPEERNRGRIAKLPREVIAVTDQEFASVSAPKPDASVVPWRKHRNPDEIFLVPSSGTTGEPKIVRQPEIAVLANCDALITHHKLKESGAWIGTSLPLFHVNALQFSFLSTLVAGARLTLFESFQIPSLLDEIENTPIKALSLTPPLIRPLLGFADRTDWTKTKLRYIVSAAAPLASGLAEAWFQKSRVPIIQGYGLSEAVNFSATMPPQLDQETYAELTFRAEFPSIGTELRGNRIFVLDDDGRELGPDTRGELALRGWNLMTSYIGDEPLATRGLSSFRTGDLGYFRELGGHRYFFVSGRKKDMIKKGGESLSLREIDDHLSLFFAARGSGDAIAVPHPDPQYGENFGILLADSAEDSAPLAKEIGDYLVNRLGAIYRPSSVESTDESFRTPSGKPQRFRFSPRFGSQS